jgi:hypothetical protein
MRRGIRCACAASVRELFVPGAKAGDHYKFDIIGPQGQPLPLKADPLKTASIVYDETKIPHPRPLPAGVNALNASISIYEVHLGSWRRKGNNRRRKGNNQWLTYRELAEQLPAYARDLGLHPCRVSSRQRAPVRRLLGLSVDWPICANKPVCTENLIRIDWLEESPNVSAL